MLRKRGLAWIAAVVLVLSLSVAPAARAADTGRADAGTLWTSIQAWAQDLLGDWLGWGTGHENSGPISTYDASEDSTEPVPPTVPLTGVPGGTTDSGEMSDPDG